MKKTKGKRFDQILKSVFILWLRQQIKCWITQAKSFKDTRKLRIGKYNNVEIFLVNGDVIKTDLFPDFVEGGNDAVYGKDNGSIAKFMPPNEVWLDANMDINSIPYICFHELWERQLMVEENMEYEEAHDRSNTVEMKLRRIRAFEDYPKSNPSAK
jgi:hypothetical protein